LNHYLSPKKRTSRDTNSAIYWLALSQNGVLIRLPIKNQCKSSNPS
jgi:hypothetical protein